MIDEILSIQQVKIVPLIFVASTVANSILVIFLKKWNNILSKRRKKEEKRIGRVI